MLGVSTGGSIALQLAADHPAAVRRLAIVSDAYQLGSRGRDAQRETAEWLRDGRPRRAAATIMAMLGTNGPGRLLLGGVGSLFGKALVGDGDTDLLATLAAEGTFDLEAHLGDITAPAIVVGGDRDPFYSADLFARTADLIPDGKSSFMRARDT
ncbi:alpha/beta fold hydrolase [Qaidamihabitans albus]|uniref:alpha/beta fold hydrolase n=1 Tax=Qaidamihabitans albus TaxID=2795733 RepID=UPI0018F18ADA|nr:alpha/beta hydrolase [Qaidamihabitans albus]